MVLTEKDNERLCRHSCLRKGKLDVHGNSTSVYIISLTGENKGFMLYVEIILFVLTKMTLK